MVFCNMFESRHGKLIGTVTILILIDGFLQFNTNSILLDVMKNVTILILIDGFLQYYKCYQLYSTRSVTILILIDGFLQ